MSINRADPLVTISDWAYAGNPMTLVKVRPDGNDSLAQRILEERTTESDKEYLASVANPKPPPLATRGDLSRLNDLIHARYGEWPDSPQLRLELARKAVREIARHMGKKPPEIWRLKIAKACDAIASLPPRSQPETGRPASEQPECKTGISLFDLAFLIEGDDAVATQQVRQWSNSKRIGAKSIGKCPLDGRRRLYELPELLSDVKEILALNAKEVSKFRQALTAKQRAPRSE